MPDLVPIVVVAILLLVVVLQILLLRRRPDVDFTAPIAAVDRSQERTERTLQASEGRLREELSQNLEAGTRQQLGMLGEISRTQQEQLAAFRTQMDTLTATNSLKLEEVRGAVERRLALIQEDNARKLEEMRKTVDEHLHATLDQRLSESFKQVSERLEQVHRGLGEMQALAAGVGDLRKVLSNVKTKGILGEILLGNLLEQMLAPAQFARDVAVTEHSLERVEFAIRLPGPDGATGRPVWLPIDSKFPTQAYQELLEAIDRGDAPAIDEAGRQLEREVHRCAKAIRDKYVNPPDTTDFAIMFLPSEGLFAEVLRRPAMIETLQGQYHVMVCGPTTLAAILNSLQMGFRTLAIQERSNEVWNLLGAIKTEFGRFGQTIDKVQGSLKAAGNHLEAMARRTRVIDRKLGAVESMPVPAEEPGLALQEASTDEHDDRGVDGE